jgi:AcrR family transcriptional regulator
MAGMVAPALTVPAPASRRTRDAILDAAERAFADRGFAGVSVREIATDAGLRNQASLYHYFPNKQAIYEASLARGVETLLPLWSGADVVGAGSLDSIFDYLAGHPHVARLIERAGLDDDPFVRDTAARLLRPLYQAGLQALEESDLPWQPSQLPHLASGLFHLVFGYFANASLLHAVLREDPFSARMLARQRQFLSGAIARLLASPDRHAAAPRTSKEPR